MSVRRLRFQIWGKVQGVGFRASARAMGRDLGLEITAENQPDGTVLIDAIGPAGQIKSFLEWVHQGPRHARVDRVQTTPIDDAVSS